MGYDEEELSEVQKRLKLAVRQMAGSLTESDPKMLPEVAIAGSGILFCFCPSKKRMVRILRGIKAFIIDGCTISKDRVLIYTFDGQLVEIEKSELIHTGCD
jgi:hypothetical protein